jgi:electron-transferring-flavoprotein dehydrogenase
MSEIERQQMDADIVCVGFGPATAGFLTTLTRELVNEDGTPVFESAIMPGMPLQIMCYERADDIGFGVSGIVTRAKSIKASFPDLDLTKEIPNVVATGREKVAYLFDHTGASQRSIGTKFVDSVFKCGRFAMGKGPQAVELPWIPPFLRKEDGLVMSMGQFMSWAGSRLMGSGLVQIWPGTPVSEALIEDDKVKGVRLVDQGVDLRGCPDSATYMPGMDVLAPLVVVGDGPVGAVGRGLDRHFGLPAGNYQHDWAVGMKVVVDLPESCLLEPGSVIHTLGFPEPEIFGFMYVYPERTASLGIFVPSWFDSPVRTTYTYLQHWMRHPYLWHHLEGARLRSWGAKSLQESGVRGEPLLCGDGFVRIGEGSGTTNVLTNSGVDEAWRSGVLLAEGVIELLRAKKPFTKDNLDEAYLRRRRADPLNKELERAKRARDGFQDSFLQGLIGTALTGITGGALNLSARSKPPSQRIKTLRQSFAGRIPEERLKQAVAKCAKDKQPLHDTVMSLVGWPEIPLDGELLMSHQDVLFKGGKVQAAGGFADHVNFAQPELCQSCTERTCIEICSAQAIMPGDENSPPEFDREKCIHCGACIWSCSKALPDDSERANIVFSAGSGGLHSNEN